MTDPISDMLTRIRNANRALLPTVAIPHSKMKESIAKILKKEGYVQDYSVDAAKLKTITLKLKYEGRRRVLEGLSRLSSPGLRRYVGAGEIPRIRGGMGTTIVSTSQGVMTGAQAKKSNVGGELLCSIW